MSFPQFADLSYLVASILFIFGLKRLSSPATARSGNAIASLGMLIAIVVTLLDKQVLNYTTLLAGIVLGSAIGAVAARRVQMTAMPQMVGIFNGFGGGASALVAAAEFFRLTGGTGSISLDAALSIMAGVFIGTVTLSGSFIAFGKLQGFVTGAPVTYPLQKTLNLLLFLTAIGLSAYVIAVRPDPNLFLAVAVVTLVLGVLLVLPIGGADMPVVISLLNSYSGLAASAAGFAIDNKVLIVSGALVGASGLILTRIMCVAMNRSLVNVLFGAVGTADAKGAPGGGPGVGDATVRETNAEEAAIMLAYAKSVIVVPGYGLAVAQAQHVARELADVLNGRGVEVRYAIHPVAGRMPGHMNVLLAEANVPYDELFDMDEINPSFERTDVALVVGANDVVNPAARHDTSSPIYGMPIMDVDKAQHVLILKRSLRPGFAGVDNELFYDAKTMMLFGDAKDSLTKLVSEVRSA